MNEKALLNAIARDPDDNLGWLAFADLLEEQGDVRAEIVRLREWLRSAHIDDPLFDSRQWRMQELLAGWRRPAALGALSPRRALELPSGRPMEMTLIPAGSFWMGSPHSEPDRYEDEGPRHRVRLSHAFWIGTCPVTQGQWRVVLGQPANYSDDEQPVDSVSWNECNSFCQRLAELTGLACRLPTEAEWEYACRAGTTTRFYSGQDEQALAQVAWYAANSHGQGQRVGQRVPNAWGLHDQLGSVWEWCADSQRTFEDGLVTDPLGEEGNLRIVRGGSRQNDPRATRCAHRGIDSLDSHLGPLGCRVVVLA